MHGKKPGNYLVRVCKVFTEPAMGFKRIFWDFVFHLFFVLGEEIDL